MTEWQDISTAPKDGTRILVTDGFDHDFASWHRDHICGEGMGQCGFTHWQPLPPPPATKADSDGDGV